MKSFWRTPAIVLALTLAGLAAGCRNPVQGPESRARLTLTFSMFTPRTLLPAADLTPARFEVSAEGPEGAVVTASCTQPTVDLADLRVGAWQIDVQAVNAAGEIIGRGGAAVSLPNSEPRTVDILVQPLAGSGTLSLEVLWTVAEIAAPRLEATLFTAGAPAIQLTFDLSVPGKATCTRAGLPAAFYTLSVRLLDGTSVKAGAVEAALILVDKTTSGLYDFTNLSLADGTVRVQIVPQLPRPVEVQMYGQLREIALGEALHLAAEAVGDPLPPISWYLNAEPLGTSAAVTLRSDLPVGLYRVDALALDAPRRMGGSASHVFKVLPSVPPGSLTFVGTLAQLGGARALAGDAAGRNLYLTAYTDNSLLVFQRDTTTGRLTPLQTLQNGASGVSGLAGASGLEVSPDGASVYAAGYTDNTLVGFARDPATGSLAPLQVFRKGEAGLTGLGGAKAVALSPDGKSVYTANSLDHGISVFDRNPATGLLTYRADLVNGAGGVQGLEGAEDLLVSPDGKQLFATGYGSDTLVVFGRDPATGALAYSRHFLDGAGGVEGLNGAAGLAISADGTSLYVAGYYDSAVAVFRRTPATGELAYAGFLKDGTGFVEGLHYAREVALSPAEDTLYVTGGGDDAIALFRRDAATGNLTYSRCWVNGEEGVAGLDGVRGIVVTRDGKNLYAAGSNSNALAVFNRYTR